MINRNIIEKLNAIPMHELFKLYGLEFEEGRNVRCPFPAHGATGNTPSFRVYHDSSFACFGCRRGGGPIHFVMNMEGIDYVHACEKLMELYGMEKLPEFSYRKLAEKNHAKCLSKDVKMKFGILGEFLKMLDPLDTKNCIKFSFLYLQVHLMTGEQFYRTSIDYMTQPFETVIQNVTQSVKDYVNQSLDVVKCLQRTPFENERLIDFRRLRSGMFYSNPAIQMDSQNGRYLFPMFLPGNVPFGFSGRTLRHEFIKYQTELGFDLEKREVIFGLDHALPYIKQLGFVIIVEGILDCARCWSVGVHNVVSPCSAALSELQVILLKPLVQNFVLFHDADEGGDNEAQSSVNNLEKYGCKHFRLKCPSEEDPDSFGKKNPQLLQNLLQSAFDQSWE